MPRRRYDLSRAGIGPGVAAIKREAGVRDSFPPAVLRAAAEARAAAPRERVELPLVTIDPPGSRDLDQALLIERAADGEPAVRAPVEGSCPDPGTTVEVRLLSSDPAARKVRFTVS